jgi:hypothetical protein
LLGLLFGPEDGGSMFLQNVDEQRIDKAQNKAIIKLYGKLYYIISSYHSYMGVSRLSVDIFNTGVDGKVSADK